MSVIVSGGCFYSFYSVLHFLLLAIICNAFLRGRSKNPDFCQTVWSIQRSTGSSQSSRWSQRSCFKTHKSIAKRVLSTCFVSGDTRREKRLSESANQTRRIGAEADSSHHRMLSSPLISTRAMRIRKPCSTPLDNAYVSAINVFRHTLRNFLVNSNTRDE